MKKEKTTFLYRVEHTDNKLRKKKHLAEVQSDSDENARRHIVHITLQEGGTVQSIAATKVKVRQPGEAPKRFYRA